MTKYDMPFASGDDITNAYGQWVEVWFEEGWRVYFVSFTFRQLSGAEPQKRRWMMNQLENQFYPTLIKHVERHPMKPSRHQYLPRFIALPDLPVFKHSKNFALRDVAVNDGWHAHAIVGMARTMRHPNGAKLSCIIEENEHRFIGPFTSIVHIDVKRIKTRPAYVAEYAFKHAKRNRDILDELLVLPKRADDMTPRDRF